MPDYLICRASVLACDERLTVERWLGRALLNDKTISVNAYRPHPGPDSAKREVRRQEIVAQAPDIGSRAEGITDRELDDLLVKTFEPSAAAGAARTSRR